MPSSTRAITVARMPATKYDRLHVDVRTDHGETRAAEDSSGCDAIRAARPACSTTKPPVEPVKFVTTASENAIIARRSTGFKGRRREVPRQRLAAGEIPGRRVVRRVASRAVTVRPPRHFARP